MTYQEARLRLANHSGLPCEELPDLASFAVVLRKATQTRSSPAVDSLAADIIVCLEEVNRELNGPKPSENKGRASERVIIEVAYFVSGIVTVGLRHLLQWSGESLFEQRDRDALTDAVYRVAFAWDQVLAGDVDDILQGILE